MSHCKQTSIISTSLKIIVAMLGLLGQALTIVNAATACTETQISDYSYPSNANETLNDTCAINFGPNVFISSGAQLSVTAPVIRLLAGTTIAHAATVRFKAEENVIQGGINQAILGPLAGSEITAYRLNDLYNSIAGPFQADNSLDNLQMAGTFRLPLVGIADDDWILVTATGGQDIDADDDGQLDAQPTANQGTLHAIATAADWRAGGVNINILSELAWQYTRSLIEQVSDDELPIRLNQLAKLWIKQDLNADGEIDWRDLLSFKSGDAEQQAKLNFNYQDLFAIKADGLSIISALHQNKSSSLELLLDRQFGANLSQNPAPDDSYTQVALEVMIFGQGQVQGEANTGINLNSSTGRHTQTVYFTKDAANILTLTAIPTAETRVVSWQGCDYVSVNSTECQVATDKAHSVMASFAYKEVQLNGTVHDLSQATNILTTDQVDVSVDAQFTELISQLAQAKVGDFIVGSTGSGFLRKITAINVLSSQHYQFTTTEATLEDVIKQGTVLLQKELVNSDLEGYTPAVAPQASAQVSRSAFTGLAGIELLPAKNPDDKTFTLDFGRQKQARSAGGVGGELTEKVTLFDDGHGGTVTAEGKISLQISIDAGVDFSFFTGLDGFKYLTTIETTESLQFDMQVIADFKKEKLIGTLQFARIPFAIGPVPIWITPQVDIFIGIKGEILAKLTTGIEFQQTLTGGILYADDGFSAVKNFTNDWTVTYPEASAEANITGWIKAVPAFGIYDVTGPELVIQEYLKLSTSESLTSEECLQKVLMASLSAGTKVSFEWDFKGESKLGTFLHLDQLEEAASFDIYNNNWEIRKWALEESPCIVPPFMTVEGIGIQAVVNESELLTQETTLILSTDGELPVNWLASYLQDGVVSVTPDSGTLMPNTSNVVTIRLDTSLVTLGKYRNDVSFINLTTQGSAAETGNKTLTVQVDIQTEILNTPVLISAIRTQSGTVELQWSYDLGEASVPLSEYYIFASNTPSDPVSWVLQKIVSIDNNSTILSDFKDVAGASFSLEAHGNGRATPASNIVTLRAVGVIPLNDTGITWGGDPNGNNSKCTGTTIGQQDCSHGRDVTHNDDSDGHAGFSFTKLDAHGSDLQAAASEWTCVRDNATGLIWEAKTNDGGIHDKDNVYRWGGVTALGSGTIGTYYDDWDDLVNGSNEEALCGFSDWRVPMIDELISLIDYSRVNMAVESDYFPNTASYVWSSSPYAGYTYSAWFVYFDNGDTSTSNRRSAFHFQVRLVRSGQ